MHTHTYTQHTHTTHTYTHITYTLHAHTYTYTRTHTNEHTHCDTHKHTHTHMLHTSPEVPVQYSMMSHSLVADRQTIPDALNCSNRKLLATTIYQAYKQTLVIYGPH